MGLGLTIFLTLLMSVQACPKKRLGRPRWRTGNQWLFEFEISEKTSIRVLREVTGKKKFFHGTPCYVTKDSWGRTEYFNLDLNTKALITRGRIEYHFIPEHPYLKWPLEVGKSWKGKYVYHMYITGQRPLTVEAEFKVAKKEEIRVPAGKFWTLKIVEKVNGSVFRERWYSPKVKNFVKKKVYWGQFVYTWVLLKYKV